MIILFKFYGKARYLKTTYENPFMEIMLVENTYKEMVVIHVNKNFDKYDLIKSGDWFMAKVNAQVKSNINKNGDVFFNTILSPDKVRALTEDEEKNIKQELKQVEQENIKEKKRKIESEKII